MPAFLLIGDSHCVAIGDAARELGVPFIGGPVAAGRDLNRDFATIENGHIVFHHPKIQQAYLARPFPGDWSISERLPATIPVLCTFGGNFHFLARREIWDGLTLGASPDAQFVSRSAFRATVAAMIEGAIAMIEQFLSLGRTVYWPMPPARIPPSAHPEVIAALRRVVPELLPAGTRVIDPGEEVLDASGTLARPYSPANAADQIHAGTRYGAAIVARLRSVHA